MIQPSPANSLSGRMLSLPLNSQPNIHTFHFFFFFFSNPVLALLLNHNHPRPFIQLQPSLPNAPADPPQGQSGRHDGHGHDGLKNQRLPHVKGGIRVGTRLEGVADHDEDAAKELSPGPENRAAGLGSRRERHFDQPLERDRQEAETSRSDHAEDDIRGRETAGPRRPDEG